MDNENLSFESPQNPIDSPDLISHPPLLSTQDQPQDTIHNYLIHQSEEPLFHSNDENDVENQENADFCDKEEQMMIVQQFLQDPYNPELREKLNFSPQKVLQEKFPELGRLNFRNQYNFYKNLASAADKQGNQARWEHLYEMDKLQRGAKELIKKNLEEEKKQNSESECTFKPMMELTKDSKFGKKAEEVTFLERTKQWAQQKKEKIEQTRIKDLDKDLVGCTFHPQITNNLEKLEKGSGILLTETSKTGEKTIKKGVDTYVKRQVQARQAKKEKETLLSQGNTQHTTKYTNSSASKKQRITKPKEFNITKGSSGSEKKLSYEDLLESHDDGIYVTDVTYGDALNYLHEELHKLKL